MNVPLFRFLIFLIAGILAALYHPVEQVEEVILLTCISLTVFFILYFLRRKMRVRIPIAATSFLFTFLLGYSIMLLNTERLYKNHFQNYSSAAEYAGVVSEPVIEKEKYFRTTLKVISVNDGQWRATTGKCLAYFVKDSSAARLAYGDVVLFSREPSVVTPYINAAGFDYQQWLAFNNIYHRVFLQRDEWHLVSRKQEFSLRGLAETCRKKLLSVYRQFDIHGKEHAVLSAITLGYRYEIDASLYQSFAASGVVHILAVSGLHVGYIFLALNFVFGLWLRNPGYTVIRNLMIILGIWVYALITGLSPSACRAATMFSFLLVGRMRSSTVDSYNLLAASAFLLLCIDPYMLLQKGFQLSYAAVFGIVYLQPKIQKWFDSDYWLLRKAWLLMSVSTAAQLFTFPLSIFYFHQFPNYFLLSNLLVIPLTMFIVLGAAALLLLSGLPVVAGPLSVALNLSLKGLIAVVGTTESLPNALVTGLFINLLQICLIYLAIFLFIEWLRNARAIYLFGLLSSLILLLGEMIV